MEEKNENSEVDLRDYLKLLLKNKWLILGIIFTAVILAFVYNYFYIYNSPSGPKVYKVSIWLEIGKTIKGNGPVELVEAPQQIAQKIKSGLYGYFPYDAVISNPAQTDLLQVQVESSDSEKTKSDLEKLSVSILGDQNVKIKNKRDLLENEIKRLEGNIYLLKQEAKDLETKLANPVSELDFLINRDKLSSTNSEIEAAYARINSLKDSLNELKETQLAKTADISLKQNQKPSGVRIIFLAALAGLFLGVFIVFWRKWWKDGV